jgi:hypothetical protein
MRPSVARLRPIRFFKQPMVQQIVQCDVKTSCSLNFYRFNINKNKKRSSRSHHTRSIHLHLRFTLVVGNQQSSAVCIDDAFTHTAPDRGCDSNVKHCFLKAQQSTTPCVGYWPVKQGVNRPCRLLTLSIPCINACPLLTLSILCINNDTLCRILILH